MQGASIIFASLVSMIISKVFLRYKPVPPYNGPSGVADRRASMQFAAAS